jgi:hypothetical protein
MGAPMGQPYGQPQQYGNAPMQAMPPKKSGNGCWIALGIVGFLFLVGAGVVGFVVWRISQDPDVKKVVGAVKEGAKLINDAQNAPGTKELKKAGCEQAMVFDVDQLMSLADKFDAGTGERPKDMPGWLVVCNVKSGSDVSCDDLAEEYVDAAEPDDSFAVMVNETGKQQPGCSNRYDESGKKIGSFAGGSVPVPTQ